MTDQTPALRLKWPSLTPDLNASMRRDIDALVDQILRDGRAQARAPAPPHQHELAGEGGLLLGPSLSGRRGEEGDGLVELLGGEVPRLDGRQ